VDFHIFNKLGLYAGDALNLNRKIFLTNIFQQVLRLIFLSCFYHPHMGFLIIVA